jgi:cytochrome c553
MRAMIVLSLYIANVFTSLIAHAADIKLGDVAAGQAKSSACVACHGIDGNSSDAQYPKIAGQHAAYIAKHLALFKSGARENAIMLAQASLLSEQDMADLGAYFSTQKVSPGITDEPLVAKGQGLFRGGDSTQALPSCMGCHGPAGHGNPAANYPAISGQHANYTKTQLERFRAGTIYGTEERAKIMSQVAKNLSDKDIQALASYIQGLHAAE